MDDTDFPIYFIVYEGWSNFSLATCINCGEIFVIDLENPNTFSLSLEQIAEKSVCPTCNSNLKETIRGYPQTIRLPNGKLDNFRPSNIIPSDEGSIIMDFFEILL
jgi:hypothetical protein